MQYLLILLLKLYRIHLVNQLARDKELLVLLKGMNMPGIVKDVRIGIRRVATVDKLIADIKEFYL